MPSKVTRIIALAGLLICGNGCWQQSVHVHSGASTEGSRRFHPVPTRPVFSTEWIDHNYVDLQPEAIGPPAEAILPAPDGAT